MKNCYIKITIADDGYIVSYNNPTDPDFNTLSVINGKDDLDATISLLNAVNEIVGPTYNKFAEENENLFIIKGPGHKSDKFDKIHNLVYRDNND